MLPAKLAPHGTRHWCTTQVFYVRCQVPDIRHFMPAESVHHFDTFWMILGLLQLQSTSSDHLCLVIVSLHLFLLLHSGPPCTFVPSFLPSVLCHSSLTCQLLWSLLGTVCHVWKGGALWPFLFFTPRFLDFGFFGPFRYLIWFNHYFKVGAPGESTLSSLVSREVPVP